MISLRFSLAAPALAIIAGAVPTLAQTSPAPLSKSPVSRIPTPRDSPAMGEMVAKGNTAMTLRPASAPNILGADDVISVSVIGHPEFSLPEATISSAGQISHPLGGLVKVSGLTLGGAAQAIKTSLAVYMKKPVVTVGLVRGRLRQVSVYGAIKVPSIINIGEGWRVSEAISQVGGLNKRPDLTSLSLTRLGKPTRKLDLQSILQSPSSPANIVLQPGDSLRFDEENVQVTMVGLFKNPGSLEMSVGSRLYDAILAAGGTLPRAALSRATLRHSSGKIVPLNLLQTSPDGSVESNPVLLTGDFISVPEQEARVTILGAVSKPGPVDLPEGKTLRLSDVLGAAGGLTIAPRTARIGIARTLENGRQIPIQIDATGLLVENDLSQNSLLREGDLITVSALKARTLVVTGQVLKPGPVEAEATDGIAQILARAGGPTPAASLRRVTVTRQGVTVGTVDMLDAVAGGPAPQFELQPDDYINVPRNEARVMVLPAVRNPGVVMMPEGRPFTLGEALAAAGGPQVGAKLREVVITRETPKGTTTQVVSLTPKAGAVSPLSLVLQDRDFVFVPEGDRGKANPVDTALRAFGTFGFLLR